MKAIDRDTDKGFPIVERPEAVAVPGDVESFHCEQAGSSFLEVGQLLQKSFAGTGERACECPFSAEGARQEVRPPDFLQLQGASIGVG